MTRPEYLAGDRGVARRPVRLPKPLEIHAKALSVTVGPEQGVGLVNMRF